MAFVTHRTGGSWEIRESRATAAGPRSRTLATFSVLTPEIVARAQSRADRPLPATQLRRAARRAGAAVAPPVGDRAAGELLAELADGRRPRPELTRLLIDALQSEPGAPTGNAQAAAAWIGASPQKRGQALRDLLLLVDRLPHRERPRRSRFPRIESRPAASEA
jgi:hypothetical protein